MKHLYLQKNLLRFQPSIILNAKRLLNGHLVHLFDIKDNSFSSYVESIDFLGSDYQIHLEFDEKDKIKSLKCSCNKNGLCKHELASLLAINELVNDPSKNPLLQKLINNLDNIDINVLNTVYEYYIYSNNLTYEKRITTSKYFLNCFNRLTLEQKQQVRDIILNFKVKDLEPNFAKLDGKSIAYLHLNKDNYIKNFISKFNEDSDNSALIYDYVFKEETYQYNKLIKDIFFKELLENKQKALNVILLINDRSKYESFPSSSFKILVSNNIKNINYEHFLNQALKENNIELAFDVMNNSNVFEDYNNFYFSYLRLLEELIFTQRKEILINQLNNNKLTSLNIGKLLFYFNIKLNDLDLNEMENHCQNNLFVQYIKIYKDPNNIDIDNSPAFLLYEIKNNLTFTSSNIDRLKDRYNNTSDFTEKLYILDILAYLKVEGLNNFLIEIIQNDKLNELYKYVTIEFILKENILDKFNVKKYEVK